MTDTPEKMKSFFDIRVDKYDEHMSSNIEDFATFYRTIAVPFVNTDEKIEVLDIGAGTGIEIEFILAKAPNARITAVDLSEAMLKKLVEKYETYSSQIHVIVDSYLSLKLMPNSFDYIVSVMSLHHLIPSQKTNLYKKLRKALLPTGVYVEGDYIVSVEEEIKFIKEYHEQKNRFSLLDEEQYHIDIPFSEETQLQTLRDAGFNNVNVLFRTSRSNVIVAKAENY